MKITLNLSQFLIIILIDFSMPSAINKKTSPHLRSKSLMKPTGINEYIQIEIRSKKIKIFCGKVLKSFQSIQSQKNCPGIPYLESTALISSKKSSINIKLPKCIYQTEGYKEQIIQRQKQKVQQFQQKSQAKAAQIKRKKQIEKVRREKEIKKLQRQIQQNHLEQKQLKQKTLKRQKTSNSLIFQDHKDQAEMIKRSRLIRTKSQRSLADQSLRQTVRSQKFEESKNKLQRKQQKYEIQYRKAFRRNLSTPKQAYPDQVFYKKLRLQAKSLNKLYSTAQNLPIKSPVKRPFSLKNLTKQKQFNLGEQLKITSIKPTFYSSSKTLKNKQKINPQKIQSQLKRKMNVKCPIVQNSPLKQQQNNQIPSNLNLIRKEDS